MIVFMLFVAFTQVVWAVAFPQDKERDIPIPPSLFGMHIHFFGKTTPWPTVHFKAWRLWDASVTWPYLEPRKGEWDFRLLDQYVEAAQKNDVEILLVLGESPRWASARPEEPSATQKGFAAEPRSIEDWRSYVRTVATRYRGRIKQYEIWNEPNLKSFYSGSMKKMLELVKEASAILKAVDSSNLVISPSITIANDGISWLEQYLEQGGGTFVDVLGIHLYVFPGPPEAMLPVVEQVKELLRRHAMSTMPIWNTEMGWAKPDTFTVEKSIGYVARTYIVSWWAGIQRVYWYAWDNHSWVSLLMTERDGRTLTPAARAYGEIQKWLIGSRMIALKVSPDSLWMSSLLTEDGDTSFVAWQSTERNPSREIEVGDFSTVSTLSGSSRSLNNDGSLKLGLAPIRLRK